MVAVVEWTVFALAVSWAICTNIALRQYYKNSDLPELPANATAMTQLTSIVGVVAAGYSPFDLLWLFPISYLTGIFALRSRIFARLAWLYGYVVTYTIPSNW
jgi:hypothetical protein